MIYLQMIIGGVAGIAAGVAILTGWAWIADRRHRRETLARFDAAMEHQKRLYPWPWERED